MQALQGFAPELSGLMQALGPVQNASVKGLPAVNSFLKDATPFFGALSPALAQINPLIQYLGAYPGELTAFFANWLSCRVMAWTIVQLVPGGAVMVGWNIIWFQNRALLEPAEPNTGCQVIGAVPE